MSAVERDPTAIGVEGPGRAGPGRAIAGWLVVLIAIAALTVLAWPKLGPLMSRSAPPTAPTAPAGTAQAPPPGASAAKARPKAAAYDYPPCTATRTDRCVQKDD